MVAAFGSPYLYVLNRSKQKYSVKDSELCSELAKNSGVAAMGLELPKPLTFLIVF